MTKRERCGIMNDRKWKVIVSMYMNLIAVLLGIMYAIYDTSLTNPEHYFKLSKSVKQFNKELSHTDWSCLEDERG